MIDDAEPLLLVKKKKIDKHPNFPFENADLSHSDNFRHACYDKKQTCLLGLLAN